jgi:hypothetical protein
MKMLSHKEARGLGGETPQDYILPKDTRGKSPRVGYYSLALADSWLLTTCYQRQSHLFSLTQGKHNERD